MISIPFLAPFKLHPLVQQPSQHFFSFCICHTEHAGIKSRLAQSFFENACLVQEMIWDNGIEHAHTSFVKHSHNGLRFPKPRGKFPAFYLLFYWKCGAGKVGYMSGIMANYTRSQPVGK